jgi:eukaryotic-like serine/threonine-protein kinase
MDVDPKVTTGSDVTSRTPDHAQPEVTENRVPNILKGRYLLGPELGRGGFAITYLASDLEVASRTVVVKVLNEYRSADAWSLNKFRHEMEALARIDHPNVVSVFDFGYREDGKPFLVMQYVAGQKLRDMIPRDGLPLAQVAGLMKQIGRALTAAHEVGVCHRDLKPENIIVQTDSEGEEHVKLIDFGIASIRAPGEEASTGISGTYSYMSPEQFQGKTSHESDVYQMGLIAYELVAGIKPFRAPTAAGILMQEMEGLKVLPTDLRPDLPDAAEEAIVKALAPNPRDRYERARDFGDALAAALVSDDWTTRSSTASGRRAKLIAAKRRRSRWIFVAASSFGVLALATVAYFFLFARPPTVDSVAVLPFQNRTGDPQMAYLAQGITESLINDLSRIPTLRVSARASVLKYDSPTVDVRTAGRELGVTELVNGFISKQGDALYLDTELIDVRSGTRLWGNAYTGKISSLTDVLEQFSREVTDRLRLKLSGPLKDRLKRQYAIGSHSYQEYLKGRFHLGKRTAADFQEAIRYFNQAIGANPDYAPAYSGLAQTYEFIAAFGSAYGGMIPAEALEKSRVAAKSALQLDGTLAEAYDALGFVEMQADYDWQSAEQEFQRAIELDPNLPEAHEDYAFNLAASGRFSEAAREAEVAERLEPDSPNVKAARGLVLLSARRYGDSLAVLTPVAKNPLTRAFVSDYVAENYWAQSRPAEAVAAIEALPPGFTPHFRIPLLVTAYARVGQTNRARQLLKSYVVQPDSAWWYGLALAHLGLHEPDTAIDDLEHGYEQRCEELIWIGVDPMLDELRQNSRFGVLVRRVRPDMK